MNNSQLKNHDILIFSFSDWDKEMVSNRYHMVKRLARHNRVFFFERPINILDWSRFRELFWPVRREGNFYLISLPDAFTPNAKKGVYQYYVQQIINHFHVREPIFWFYNYQLGYLIDTYKPKLACYHCTEDYAYSSIIHSRYEMIEEIIDQERLFVQKVDAVFAVSEALKRRHRKSNPRTYLTTNAVEYDLYRAAQGSSGVAFNQRKVIGCSGNFSSKIDFELLDYLSVRLPGNQFLLIGPVLVNSPVVRKLRSKKNITFIGKQPVDKLVALLKDVDVLLIPYITDQWFQKASQPLRLYEYLATGKPLVSTPMDCLKKINGLIYVGETHQEILGQLKLAMREKGDSLRRKRIKLAQENTWDNRFDYISARVNEILEEKIERPSFSPTLEYFQKRKKPQWILGNSDYYLANNQQIKDEADEICRHHFTVLNRSFQFKNGIDWSAQFDGPGIWAKGDINRLNQVTYADNFNNSNYIGDVKLVWEFNKHLHFIKLAQAYILTQNEKYVRETVDEITGWIKENPYGFNQAWTQNLIVSHRAIGWVVALGAIIQSPALTSEIWQNIFRSLNEHSQFIKAHYEVGEKSSNHLIGNLAAQILICSIFPEIDNAIEKKFEAIKMLEAELKKQIYADGVDYEESLSYHRVVLEFLLLLHLVESNGDLKLPKSIRQKTIAMTEFLMNMTQPSGFYQPISDADGAKVFILQNNVLDSRPYLSLAGILFNRADFKFMGQNRLAEIGFYLKDKHQKIDRKLKPVPPKYTSRAFQDGGYWTLRQNWTKNSAWVFFDCGRISLGDNPSDQSIGSHGHSDTLNFGLAIGEQTVFTDIGSYCYTTKQDFHHYFRSGFAHNIPIIDNQDENELTSAPWTLFPQAIGKNTRQKFTPNFDYLSGEHHGYEKLNNPIILRRELLWAKKEKYLVICDQFTGAGRHQIDERFHLYPGLKATIGSEDIKINSNPPVTVKAFFKQTPNIVSAKFNPVDGWYAIDYGKKTRAEVINLTTEVAAPGELIILINWGKSVIKLEQIKQKLKEYRFNG